MNYVGKAAYRPLTEEEFDALCETNSFGAVARGDFPLIPRAMLKHLVDTALAQRQAEPVYALTRDEIYRMAIEADASFETAESMFKFAELVAEAATKAKGKG
jgi:hypothetical protein